MATITLNVNITEDQNDGQDQNGLSLRDAIIQANSDQENDYVIELVGGEHYNLTIEGDEIQSNTDKGGDLDIYTVKNVTIKATGTEKAVVDASGLSSGNRVFQVISGANVTMENIVITGGKKNAGAGLLNDGNLTIKNSTVVGNEATTDGGGILNNGSLLLMDTNVSENTAVRNGGGLYNNGGLRFVNSLLNDNSATNGGGAFNNQANSQFIAVNSTLSQNKAIDDGGGIYNNSGFVVAANTTITKNTADLNSGGAGNGGGIYNQQNQQGESGAVNLINTIVARNVDKSSPSDIPGIAGPKQPDLSGTFIGDGNNLIGSLKGATGDIGTGSDIVDPKPRLGALRDNGGATLTHALLPDSPAVNQGSTDYLSQDVFDLDGDGDTEELFPFDQRGQGFPRIEGGAVDIGAFELPENRTINGTRQDDTLSGGAGNDTINGIAGNDTISGNYGADSLDGGNGDDILYGGKKKDILNGGYGNDTLVGRLDRDTLIGGGGSDSFAFELPEQGGDVITDFNLSQDLITISAAGFGGGLQADTQLTEEQFILGANALDESDRFMYNKFNGRLFFDADGSGTGSRVLVATLTTKPELTANNIEIVA